MSKSFYFLIYLIFKYNYKIFIGLKDISSIMILFVADLKHMAKVNRKELRCVLMNAHASLLINNTASV